MGTDGMRSEIENMNNLKSFPLSDYPRARYIGCSEVENGTYLFWKGEDGTCYMGILGVMEVERWFQNIQKKNKKRASSSNWMPGEPLENNTTI